MSLYWVDNPGCYSGLYANGRLVAYIFNEVPDHVIARIWSAIFDPEIALSTRLATISYNTIEEAKSDIEKLIPGMVTDEES